MDQRQAITGTRRIYNQWVANETLEDFALRFTARRARKWTSRWVANTALGSISFLALEAIGGALTLSYGHDNAVTAILLVGFILVLTGLPISYHAAKSGVDIELLTRGAGFGYLGSTITSLIYASFTFIFFALEAAILSYALELCFGLPMAIGYILNAFIVLPLVTHGFTRIGMFQAWTQPFWIALQVIPFALVIYFGDGIDDWVTHSGRLGDPQGGIDIVLVAAAAGVALSLIAQIGEQVDFLRFLPEPQSRAERFLWWLSLLAAGPGWAIIGTLKMLIGSYLAVMIFNAGASPEQAVEPTRMYLAAFEEFFPAHIALLITGIFVLIAQLKINVTNAYAGSIAWSNFFARVTHSHPGRIVWLVFNVLIALLLMEFGVFGALENILAIYSHAAVAWIGALAADLIINRPLGLRPKQIEFRRAYLCDINPVGVGAMLLATGGSLLSFLGFFGETLEAFSSLIALAIALTAAPVIALITGGRYYLARDPQWTGDKIEKECTICRHSFDPEDLVSCPFHSGIICSLCCSLESACADSCKPEGRLEHQFSVFAKRYLPKTIGQFLHSFYGRFTAVTAAFTIVIGLVLLMMRQQAIESTPNAAPVIDHVLGLAFGMISIVVGVVAWLYVLAHESRARADEERDLQTGRLFGEIRAHRRTEAELQRAKSVAESANEAKSRYLIGISHELRTPLNAILGYAQLLERDPSIPMHRRSGLRVIRRSSEHLADLIEGLLDISKIEAGRLEVYRNEFKLRELINQLVSVFRMEAAEKNLTIDLWVAPSVPSLVYTDERRIRQILINLLSNAVRYTDTGLVSLRVDYRNEIATFEIRDTGRGISKADREKIFEPFVRIESSDAPVHGTGLGLTITKLLIDVLGGDLQFQSEIGKGSCFTVKLMLPRISNSETKPPRQIFGYRGPRRRIMIVDDNTEHRTLLEDTWNPLGFEISMAETAEAALAVVDVAKPDLLLIDVAMPGMSGWSLAQHLREKKITVPIIVISAHAIDQTPSGNGRRYHDDFFMKPLNMDKLLSRIEYFLEIQWVYEDFSKIQPVHFKAPALLLDQLEEMIAIGHVRGAERIINNIANGAHKSDAFVARARALLEQIDMHGLRRLIKEARHGAAK